MLVVGVRLGVEAGLEGALRMVDDASEAETEAEKLRTSSTTSGWSCDDEEVRRCRNQADNKQKPVIIVVNSSTSFEIPSTNCSDIEKVFKVEYVE